MRKLEIFCICLNNELLEIVNKLNYIPVGLGDGKFDVVGYPGGLPGAGWDGDKENRVRGKGQTVDGKTSFEMANGLKVSLKDEVMHVTSEGEKVENIFNA